MPYGNLQNWQEADLVVHGRTERELACKKSLNGHGLE